MQPSLQTESWTFFWKKRLKSSERPWERVGSEGEVWCPDAYLAYARTEVGPEPCHSATDPGERSFQHQNAQVLSLSFLINSSWGYTCTFDFWRVPALLNEFLMNKWPRTSACTCVKVFSWLEKFLLSCTLFTGANYIPSTRLGSWDRKMDGLETQF